MDLGFYNGRNKTFFFTAVEWLYDTFPEPGQFTVPTEAQRNGDFSALLSLGIQHLRPGHRAARERPGRARTAVSRQHHPGQPHQPGRARDAEVLPAAQPGRQRAGAEQLPQHQRARRRLLLVQRPRRSPVQQRQQRLFVRYSRNNRTEYRGNWTGEQSTASSRPATSSSASTTPSPVDHVWTMSPDDRCSTCAAAGRRFQEPNLRQHQGLFDPASLGFSSSTAGAVRRLQVLSAHRATAPTARSATRTPAAPTRPSSPFQPTITKFWGNHSVRAGYDFRVYPEVGEPSCHVAGAYDFNQRLHRRRHGQLAQRADRPGSRVAAARPAGERTSQIEIAPTRVQPKRLSGRLRAGRLEGHRQADGEPRPALRVRGRADRRATTATCAASTRRRR